MTQTTKRSVLTLSGIKKTDDNLSDKSTDKAKTQKKKLFITPDDYQKILSYMSDRFPKCFIQDAPVPLAIGICEKLLDVKDIGFSKTMIRKFLKLYTRRKIYRDTLIVGNDRINLDGSFASKVIFKKKEELTQE